MSLIYAIPVEPGHFIQTQHAAPNISSSFSCSGLLQIFLTAWRAIQIFRFTDVYYLLAKHIEHFNFRREMSKVAYCSSLHC